jgi:antitoxin YefM
MDIRTPTDARKDFYQLLKMVNHNHEPVYIKGKYEESNAVIISLKDWNSIKEKLKPE